MAGVESAIPRRVEDTLLDELGKSAAGHAFEQHADRAVAEVGVQAVLTGREAELGVGERNDVEARIRGEVRRGDQPRGVGEEVVQGERVELAAAGRNHGR